MPRRALQRMGRPVSEKRLIKPKEEIVKSPRSLKREIPVSRVLSNALIAESRTFGYSYDYRYLDGLAHRHGISRLDLARILRQMWALGKFQRTKPVEDTILQYEDYIQGIVKRYRK